MEEMYGKADLEKKEIREIREIFSGKSKFLESVFDVEFAYNKIVGDSGYVNYIDGFANYEADNDSELEYFYLVYKACGGVELLFAKKILGGDVWEMR